MTQFPREGTPHGIHPEHCAAIKEVNYCRGGNCSQASANACDDSPTGPCRFYDGFPRYLDLCHSLALPLACGQTTPPPSEICYHITEGRVGTRTRFETRWNVATNEPYVVEVLDVVEELSSYIHCVPLVWPTATGPGPDAADVDLEGEGPILFFRSKFVDPMTGAIPVSGVLREDLFGLGRLAFWLDGQPTSLQGLQTGLFDPYTCSEDPAPQCDAFSGWSGYLDTAGLAHGLHTLTVVGTHLRPGEPIPNMDTVSFFVDHNQGGCSETTPPSVSLTAPAADSTVSGGVSVTASASDASGIEKVQFYVDWISGARSQFSTCRCWR